MLKWIVSRQRENQDKIDNKRNELDQKKIENQDEINEKKNELNGQVQGTQEGRMANRMDAHRARVAGP